MKVPLPPLPEQRRIVGILDEAFEGIATAKANAEKNLQNARALFESHLQAIFAERGDEWDRETLATLLERGWIESHLDGNHGSDYPRKDEFIGQGIPYISANIRNFVLLHLIQESETMSSFLKEVLVSLNHTEHREKTQQKR